MGNFSKLFNKITDTKINPGDEKELAKNPRNMLADAVNPLLDEYVNPVLPEKIRLAIPKMTVADDKQYFQNLPENMAGATMGSIKTIPSQRFGNILHIANDVPENIGKVITKPGVQPANLGTVTTKPSMADLVDDVSKFGQKKELDAKGILDTFRTQYADEIVKRKAQKNPVAYDSWKQEMLDKIRRGE